MQAHRTNTPVAHTDDLGMDSLCREPLSQLSAFDYISVSTCVRLDPDEQYSCKGMYLGISAEIARSECTRRRSTQWVISKARGQSAI